MLDRLRLFPYYVILVSIYPALNLISINLFEMKISDGIRAIWVSIIFSILVLLIFRILARDIQIAGLISFLLITIFFIYGHIHQSFPYKIIVFGAPIRNHRNLLVIFGMLFLALVVLIWKIKNKKELITKLNQTLNVAAIALLVLPSFSLVSYLFNNSLNTSGSVIFESFNSADYKDQPDIYFFVLDMYPRQDFLFEKMDIDNSDFIKYLTDSGFYIASCSQSNYQSTAASILTTLNMDYFENFSESFDIEGGEKNLSPMIKHSIVRGFLENRGYSTVAFQTMFVWSEIEDANYYYSIDWEESNEFLNDIRKQFTDMSPVTRYLLKFNINDFEWLFLNNTAFSVIIDLSSPKQDLTAFNENNNRVNYKLKKYFLSNYVIDTVNNEIPKLPGPKFVFVHLLLPHQPFVFQADGSFRTEDAAYIDGFSDHVVFLNREMVKTISIIRETSDIDPIIIIMGDHGPVLEGEINTINRETENLEALYLPNASNNTSLYPTISPVNIFRVIFNEYFSQNYELLPDVSYHSDTEKLGGFYPVDNPISNCNMEMTR